MLMNIHTLLIQNYTVVHFYLKNGRLKEQLLELKIKFDKYNSFLEMLVEFPFKWKRSPHLNLQIT